jgi:GTP-binding protein Era
MKSGTVSFLGRPNAGKSTLLNRIVGHKVAIVSDKPQTTRTRVVGVKNYDAGQVVFLDTPGVHKPTHRLNRRMVRLAVDASREVDVAVLVVDASVKPGPGDAFLLEIVQGLTNPVVLVLNKVDLIAKPRLLPLIDRYRQAHPFAEIVPLSALDGLNVDRLEQALLAHLPDGEPRYPPEYLTDQTDRTFAAEIVREHLLHVMRDELPFATAVLVERYDDSSDVLEDLLHRVVDRESQKPIVVGKGGAMVKAIGTAARAELEATFERKVHLELHVKVRAEWRDDERLLDELGVPRA